MEDAVAVHSSNRIAVRLTPCDVLARVGPLSQQNGLDFELEVGRRLARTDAPVAEPDPRPEPSVHVRGDFAVTLWTYYEPMPPLDVGAAEYADALARLHAGMCQIEVRSPHFTDRVAEAQRLLADREQTPELPDAERELLNGSLHQLTSAVSGRGADEQLLHGEPHLGNVLRTDSGLRFIDLETCCRGPVELDIAHALLPSDGRRMLTARALAEHHPDADQEAIEESLALIWAMVTTWRWCRDDELPNGRYWRVEGIKQLQLALDRLGVRAPEQETDDRRGVASG